MRYMIFLADNIEEFYGSKNTTIVKRKSSRLPKKVIYTHKNNKYVIYDRGTICMNTLRELYYETRYLPVTFDHELYHALYKDHIELIYDDSLSIQEKTVLYYVKYGYWYDLHIHDVCMEDYLASYYGVLKDVDDLRFHFMMNKKPILFSKYTYLASNFELLKTVPIDELRRHYIINGHHQGLKFDSFDHYTYLSENPYAIDKIINKEYNISLLTQTKVAEYFVKNKGKKAMDTSFKASTFMKEYLKDTRVNYDNNMCLNNAHIYFVKGYVESKDIRQHITKLFKMKRFAKQRIKDGLKQLPFGIIRYIIEFKLYA